jgi:hypothetical protein
MLQPWYDKMLFGFIHLLTGGAMLASGVFSDGEWRWLCLAGASSLFTACALALIVKAPHETIRVATGRSLLAILIGVFGSYEMVLRYGIEGFGSDAVRVMGAAGMMTVGGFTVGYVLLLLLNSQSRKIAKLLLKRWLGEIKLDDEEK